MGGLIQGAATMYNGEQQGEADSKAALLTNERAQAALAYDSRLALLKGANEAGAVRTSGSELAAQQNTAYANSGVDQAVGTAANVQNSTDIASELDAQTARNNAAREAWGYKVQSGYATQDKDTALANSTRKQVGSVLTGLSQVGSMAGGGGGG